MTLTPRDFGMDSIMLSEYEIPADVLAMLPRELAVQYKAVPVYKHGNVLTIALSDPLDVDTVESLQEALNLTIEPVIASSKDIEAALTRYYGDE